MPEWTGGSLGSVLARLTAANELGAPAALEELAQKVERRAKLNANTGSHRPGEPHVPGTGPGPNVVLGNLWRNISHTRPSQDAEGWFARVGVAFAAPYGKYLETGLRNGVKYPFLLPAARSETSGVGGVFRANYHF